MRQIIPTPAARRSAGTPTLRSLVAAVVDELQRQAADSDRPLPQLTIDVAVDHQLPADVAALRSLLERGLGEAVRATAASATMARNAEVVITSVQYSDRLELEIADSGPARAERQATGGLFGDGMAADGARSLLDRLAAEVRLDDCPEGGVALTLSIPLAVARRAAA
ncbi:MAG: hypothetical protein ACO37F_13515 [Pirellulales bacterium]|jgi:hypothetical protein